MTMARLKVALGYDKAKKVEHGIRMQTIRHSESALVTVMMSALTLTMVLSTQCIKNAHTIHQI
jgi:hypothetical protein